LKTTDYDSDFNFNTQIIKNNKAFNNNNIKRIDLKKKINLKNILNTQSSVPPQSQNAKKLNFNNHCSDQFKNG